MIKVIVYFICGALIVCIFYGFYSDIQKKKLSQINSFEDCAKDNEVISGSYPPQCRTSDGKIFVKDVGNGFEYQDEILVNFPKPNQKISNPLIISGKAKGMWYSEGSFSTELLDANEVSLGTTQINALGEWMSEDFVPFYGALQFKKSTTNKGKLILKNANPSGDPDTQKELIIPIEFK